MKRAQDLQDELKADAEEVLMEELEAKVVLWLILPVTSQR